VLQAHDLQTQAPTKVAVHQQEATQVPASADSTTNEAPVDEANAKVLQTLQTRRAQLLGERLNLENRLKTFRENQMRAAEDERQRKEFGLKR
jgi:hypothetical protein